MPVEDVLGVVLAGGSSHRMGFDKRRFEIRGRSLVLRAAEALRSECVEVVVSTQPGSSWTEPSLRAIADLRSDCGPLAGLEAALSASVASRRSVFVLACDLPYVSTELIGYIVRSAAAARSSAAVVPSVAGRVQPLCGLYRPETLEVVRRQLDSGSRAMRDLLAILSVETVEIHPELALYRSDLFHNLNEPADLEPLSDAPTP